MASSGRKTMFECGDCKRLFHDMETFDKHECDDADSGGYDASTLFAEEGCLDLCPEPLPDISQPSTSTACTSSESTSTIWTRSATLYLIDLYKTNEGLVKQGKLRKKAMWLQIAKALQEKSHNMTSSQCEGRWKTLVRGMKNVFDHNKKSGHDKKYHPYEDELAFLGDRPNINPVYVATTTQSGHNTDDENSGASASPTSGKDFQSNNEENVSKICMEDEASIDTAFVPCGHMVTCHACSIKCKTCPMCRGDIAQALKVFKI